jgi:hypothetical protein
MTSFDDEHPNFTRRYKWAFEPEYATSFELAPVAQPDIQQYLRECDEVLMHIDGQEGTNPGGGGGSGIEDTKTTNPPESTTNFQYPAECVELAKSICEEMQGKNDHGAWAGPWAKERVQVSLITENIYNVSYSLEVDPAAQ